MAARPADAFFVMGAMNVDVALISVHIPRLQPLEPQNAREHKITHRVHFWHPHPHRLTGFEDRADIRAIPMLFFDDEPAQWGFIAALGETDAKLGSAARPLSGNNMPLDQSHTLVANGDFNTGRVKTHSTISDLNSSACQPRLQAIYQIPSKVCAMGKGPFE